MPNVTERQGQCLCGVVTITAKNADNKVGACHCKTCRQWGSGPLMAVDCGTDVSIDGEEHMSIFNSSEWAERGFCNKCGTHLFYRLKETGQYMLSVGIFESDQNIVFDHQVFIDEKPAFYQFANETENMTGAELFAKYGASE